MGQVVLHAHPPWQGRWRSNRTPGRPRTGPAGADRIGRDRTGYPRLRPGGTAGARPTDPERSAGGGHPASVLLSGPASAGRPNSANGRRDIPMRSVYRWPYHESLLAELSDRLSPAVEPRLLDQATGLASEATGRASQEIAIRPRASCGDRDRDPPRGRSGELDRRLWRRARGACGRCSGACCQARINHRPEEVRDRGRHAVGARLDGWAIAGSVR